MRNTNSKSKAKVLFTITLLAFIANSIIILIINCKTVTKASLDSSLCADNTDFWVSNENEYKFIKSCIDNADEIWDIYSDGKDYCIELKNGDIKTYPVGNMSSKQALKIAFFVENSALSGIKYDDVAADSNNGVAFIRNGVYTACFHNWHETIFTEYENYFNTFDSNISSTSIDLNHVRLITRNRCVPYVEIRETGAMIPLSDTESLHEVLSGDELSEVIKIMNVLDVEIPSYLKPQNKSGA